MPIRKLVLSLLLVVVLAVQPVIGTTQVLAQDAGDNEFEDDVVVEDEPSEEDYQDDLEQDEGETLILDETADKVRFVGKSTIALKMRKAPSKTASGVGGLAIDTDVYIMSMDSTWAKVLKGESSIGYVQSKYLEDIRYYDPDTNQVGEPVKFINASQGATYSANGFIRNFIGHTLIKTSMYKEPSVDSEVECRVGIYKQLYINSFGDDGWAYCEIGEHFGYIKTEQLFKYDRIDPYAGAIPGCIVYPLMATVKRTTDILSYEDGTTVLKTIYPGACICVEEPDEQGRYKTPYWRTTGYITQDDIYQLTRVAPYDIAQPGDLVSVMTTYYNLGIVNANYMGRNWNIYLSTSMISSRLLQPNEQFDMNDTIGPYLKGTGYKTAPIASPNASVGYGGGTCQVNTTAYNLVIQVPIFVNHRQVHANAGAKYFLKGFDAAVGAREATNMIFTNTLPYPIRINFLISDGALTACMYRATEE